MGDGNAWHGPAEVIYQKGNAVFIHSNGYVKKVAACKVKPNDLKERTEEEKEAKNDEESPEIIEEERKKEKKKGKKNLKDIKPEIFFPLKKDPWTSCAWTFQSVKTN